MSEEEKYQIVHFSSKHSRQAMEAYMEFEPTEVRFAIADSNGKIIDDAQGYGYKTKQKAYLAMNWKFKGGKQKTKARENNYRQWVKENPIHKQAIKKFDEYLEWNFKEIARGETTLNEMWNELEKEFKIVIPDFVKKQHLK